MAPVVPNPRHDEHVQLSHVRADLRREFAALPPAVVDAQVSAAEQALTGARIRSFVPVLVQRGARERLRHLP
jgi:hypothetical protein